MHNKTDQNSSQNDKILETPQNTSTSLLENKLKYLAHLHHSPQMVGKILKPVDLENIQKLIDTVKYGFGYYQELPLADENSNETKEPIDKGKGLGKKSRFSRDYDLENDDYFESTAQNEALYFDYMDDSDVRSKSKLRRKKKKPNNYENIDFNGDTQKQKISKTKQDVSFSSDFPEIQLKITPEQEMDIHKFKADMNSRPQPFSFDVDKFLQDKSLLETHVATAFPDDLTTKKYFEFSQNFNKRDSKKQQQNHDNTNQEKLRLEANTQNEAFRDLVRANENYNSMQDYYENIFRKQLAENAKKKVVNQFNLFNDGRSDISKEIKDKANNLNMVDLGINLRLNKEFQDFKILQGDSSKNNINNGDKNIKDDFFGVIR